MPYNCGPWLVEAVRSLVESNQLPPSNFDIESARGRHAQILGSRTRTPVFADLMDVISENTTLKTLIFENLLFNGNEIEKLGECLRKNRSLRIVKLDNVDLHNTFAQLTDGLKDHNSLQEFYVNHA